MTRTRYLLGAATTAIVLGAASSASAQTVAPLPTAPAATGSVTAQTSTADIKLAVADPQTGADGRLQPLYGRIRGWSGDFSPLYGRIRGWSGDLNPLYGRIRGWSGDFDPFYKNIAGFWGTMDPATMATAAGSPVFANVAPFWEGLGSQWDAIAADWETAGTYSSNEAKYAAIAGKLQSMVDTSSKFWGQTVTKQTGKSFQNGFADPMFAKFGINPADPASLAKLPAGEQAHFFIEWYDGLMEFSGTDHVDWWMQAVNWTPKLTQTQGGGSDAVIGLVDFFVAADADIKSKLIYSGGVSSYSTGHGSGVGSLIVASHDGKGVMGIAPMAKVAAYNPFDASGTADWPDVIKGIRAVSYAGASVVNLSLGVPGATLAPEWAGVFRDPYVKLMSNKPVYVIAAGNDGISQTGNIDMTNALDSPFIVVGSVDPNNNISAFSNRPGNACLTVWGYCDRNPTSLSSSGYLMNRFIVAPGELILVADGNGGVTRESGTSLAAPLVSGAIALIQDRWPWLKKYPADVVNIILKSAKDLGAPGVDPVYGVGMLDVEASQSPLSFDALTYYRYEGKNTFSVPVKSLKGKGVQASWEAANMYLVAFEQTQSSYRDFLIPLSSRLVGTTRNGEYFQDFVYNRMTGWLTGTANLNAGAPALGFSDVQRFGQVGTMGGWTMQLSGRRADGFATDDGYVRPDVHSAVALTAPSGRFGLTMGSGDGAVLLGGMGAMQMTSDFDPVSGGANPLLGFATGGAHVAASIGLTPDLTVTVGSTRQDRSRQRDLLGLDRADQLLIGQLQRYRAEAGNVRVDYRIAQGLNVAAAYTRLAEPNALLGVRSLDDGDFRGGSTTDGFTLSADLAVGGGVALFGSATGSRARSTSNSGTLRVGDGGVIGSAYQLGIAKAGLIGRGDRLRLSLAQPLRVERGTVDLTTVEVIDRETGEIGPVTRSYDVVPTGKRRLVAEGLYGAPLLDGRAELSLFGRGELRAVDAATPDLMIGTRAQLSF